MLENKDIEIIKKEVEKLIQQEKVFVNKKEKDYFTKFFLDNSENSLNTARLLMDISNNYLLRKEVGYPDLNSYLWVINASYYSMFYVVRALLENSGIILKADSSTQSIHLLTFYALIYYFYLNKKLEFKLIKDFQEANEESSELLGKEKAKKFMEEYELEKEKRNFFTYNLGFVAIKSKAETSLNRAIYFNQEIRKLITF